MALSPRQLAGLLCARFQCLVWRFWCLVCPEPGLACRSGMRGRAEADGAELKASCGPAVCLLLVSVPDAYSEPDLACAALQNRMGLSPKQVAALAQTRFGVSVGACPKPDLACAEADGAEPEAAGGAGADAAAPADRHRHAAGRARAAGRNDPGARQTIALHWPLRIHRITQILEGYRSALTDIGTLLADRRVQQGASIRVL